MSKMCLDIEGMELRDLLFNNCGDIDEPFDAMIQIDNSLMEIDTILSSCAVLSPLNYSSLAGEINEERDNIKILGDYPPNLTAELYEEFDYDFACGVRQALDELKSIKIDNLEYMDASSDDLIAIPAVQLKNMVNEIKEVSQELSKAPLEQLMALYRVTEDAQMRDRLEIYLKNHFRLIKYDENSQLADLFPNLEMEDIVYNYEVSHKNDKEKVDNLLLKENNDLTADDVLNIKYMLYTADENYRELFMKGIGDYRIITTDLEKGAYYTNNRLKGKGLYYTHEEDFGYDLKGKYVTFYHECGHATDSNVDVLNKWSYDSIKYKKNMYNQGKMEEWTIRSCLEYDVFYNTQNPHSIASLARTEANAMNMTNPDEAVNNVIIALQTKGDENNKSTDGLSYKEQTLYSNIVSYMQNDLSGPQHESPSDIYNGLTYNVFMSKYNYGHEDKYFDNVWDENDSDYNNPTLEVWAEWFSYKMTGNEEMIAIEKEYFPRTTEFMEEFVKDEIAK